MLFDVLLPYPHLVTEYLQRRQILPVTLVFEQKINVKVGVPETGGVKYIGKMFPQFPVNEAVFGNGQSSHVRMSQQGAGEIVPQKTFRNLLPGEGLLKKFVVNVGYLSHIFKINSCERL